MAKKCKLIHVNQGSGKVLENGNFCFVEEFSWAEAYLERYLNDGYQLKHMTSEVSPNILQDGEYTFYKDGYTFYLEKEVPDDQMEEETIQEEEAIQEEEYDLYDMDPIDVIDIFEDEDE